MATKEKRNILAEVAAMVAAGACPKFVGYCVTRGWLKVGAPA